MNEERCELCAFFARLSHNFHSRNGFEETNCCVFHPLTQNELWVIETTPCDRCEAFKKKEVVYE